MKGTTRLVVFLIGIAVTVLIVAGAVVWIERKKLTYTLTLGGP